MRHAVNNAQIVGMRVEIVWSLAASQAECRRFDPDRPLHLFKHLAGDSSRNPLAVLIYRRTGNLRAVQLLLGHARIESTVRYLGIETDDATEIAD